MNRNAKIATAASALVVAGLVALAAPAVVALGEAAAPIIETAASASAAAEEESAARALQDLAPDGWTVDVAQRSVAEHAPPVDTDPCEERVRISAGQMHASVDGELVDMGVREFAAGTVGLDDEGRIKTYTVAPGDALFAIGDRFCIENALVLDGLNHTHSIAPGEVLLLAPDGSIPWVDYYSPVDAPEGFYQVPYQLALQAMSRAAHRGDVDEMRAIFADGLADMFPRQRDRDLIAWALADGNLDVLVQMFA